jgi:hypothetical protein
VSEARFTLLEDAKAGDVLVMDADTGMLVRSNSPKPVQVVTEMADDRLTDTATGLPPLEDVDPNNALLVFSWIGSHGISTVPGTNETIPVRFLSVRGIARGEDDNPMSPIWSQIHLAVPTMAAVDVAATLATGGAT